MARRHPGRLRWSHSLLAREATARWRGPLSWLALAATATLLPVGSAGAAKLSQVRIGTHSDHTRIVLELDAPASYRLLPQMPGAKQIQIQLDAQSPARRVPSKSPLVQAVRVVPSPQGALVAVDLSRAGVDVSEMILSDPPRLVFDVSRAQATAAAAPPRPAPAPTPRAPSPSAATASAASPSPSGPGVPAEPGEVAVVATTAEPEPPASAPAAAGEPDAHAPSLSDPVPSDVSSGQNAAAAETSSASAPASSAPAETSPAAPPPAAQPEPPSKPAEVVVRRPSQPANAAKARSHSFLGTLLSPAGYAAIGGILMALIVLTVMRRRRDAEEDDPLYSVMSADDAGAEADAGYETDEGAPNWSEADEASAGDAWGESEQAGASDDDSPVPRESQLSLGPQRASESIFDQSEPSPVEPEPEEPEAAPAAFAPVAASAAAVHSGSLDGELSDRVADLERRLEQLFEARERLERQVAAQTEELRVQRAAIARTQRVVRSMSKGEDVATEPVPRAPNV